MPNVIFLGILIQQLSLIHDPGSQLVLGALWNGMPRQNYSSVDIEFFAFISLLLWNQANLWRITSHIGLIKTHTRVPEPCEYCTARSLCDCALQSLGRRTVEPVYRNHPGEQEFCVCLGLVILMWRYHSWVDVLDGYLERWSL